MIEGSLVSEAVGRTLPYLAYLPPGYDADPSRRYPVLYLLHGLGASYTQWQQCGVFDADRLIAAGETGTVHHRAAPRRARLLGRSAPAAGRAGAPTWRATSSRIDARFRTLPARERRAIGGISMGGHGPLRSPSTTHPSSASSARIVSPCAGTTPRRRSSATAPVRCPRPGRPRARAGGASCLPGST
ncbi:MAG: alpha/beta hydrolase-fold protein [Dehalococcoidia bacterium]